MHIPSLSNGCPIDIPSLIDTEYPWNIPGIWEEYPRNIYAFGRAGGRRKEIEGEREKRACIAL
jgi:hypothetical protein